MWREGAHHSLPELSHRVQWVSAHTTSVGRLCSCCVRGQRYPPAGRWREPQDGCGVGPNEVLDNALLHADIPALVAHLNFIVHVHTHIQCVQSVGESDTVHTAAAADPPGPHTTTRAADWMQLTWCTAGC